MTTTPSGRLPSSVTRIVFCFFWRRVWVANTHSHSLAPMPKAIAPKAPWVEVWLSPQTSVDAGQRKAEFRPDHVDDAMPLVAHRNVVDAELLGRFRIKVASRMISVTSP